MSGMFGETKDRVTVIGERADGSREIIGTAPMPPKMKMREIVRNYFGEPTCGPDDCDEASMCMYALEAYHEWILEQGWTAPPMKVSPNTEMKGGGQ